ncbi:MAG: ketopantoate reductase family protein [Thermoplasmata archaeon]
MRFLVFGAGAMGSLVGGLLSQQHETVLVGRRAHVEAIRERGLQITGKTQLIARPTAEEGIPPDADPDVVIVAVKAYDTEHAARTLAPLTGQALFLSLQNGLGNEETLAAAGARVLGGVTNQGITWVRPGEVHHAGEGETYIGPFEGIGPEDADDVVAAFAESGLPSHRVDDIRSELWLKAIVNACINPLTALLRVPNGYVLQTEATEQVVRNVIQEGVEVAARYDVDLAEDAVFERVAAVVQGTAANRSSMLQDLERGRRTEIEAINGAIARLGQEAGRPAPRNELLARLVRAAEGTPKAG